MNTENPLVSIILPTFNRPSFLFQAVNSVLNQSYPNFELIVIDDGSDEDTAEMLDSIKDKRLKVHKIQNSGRSYARNVGISRAEGDLVTFLDDDDMYDQNKLQIQVNFLRMNSQFQVVYTSANCFNDENNETIMTYHANLSGNIYNEIALYVPHPICLPTVMVTKEVLDEIGNFDINLDRFEDIDMWRRISRKYEFGAVNEPLCRIRTHHDNEITNLDLKKLALQVDLYIGKVLREDLSKQGLRLLCLCSNLYAHYGKAIFKQSNGKIQGLRLLAKAILLKNKFKMLRIIQKVMGVKSDIFIYKYVFRCELDK